MPRSPGIRRLGVQVGQRLSVRRIPGLRLLRLRQAEVVEEQLLELDEEKDRLRLELDKIRGTMEKLDIEYARDIRRLDEGLGKGGCSQGT